MLVLTQIIRILLGVVLVLFAANALFIHAFKPKMKPEAGKLIEAFRSSGYLLTFVQWTELIVGVLLITGYFTPLALLVLFPVSVNILLFHVFVSRSVFGPGLIIFLFNTFLLWAYRSDFINLLNI